MKAVQYNQPAISELDDPLRVVPYMGLITLQCFWQMEKSPGGLWWVEVPVAKLIHNPPSYTTDTLFLSSLGKVSVSWKIGWEVSTESTSLIKYFFAEVSLRWVFTWDENIWTLLQRVLSTYFFPRFPLSSVFLWYCFQNSKHPGNSPWVHL